MNELELYKHCQNVLTYFDFAFLSHFLALSINRKPAVVSAAQRKKMVNNLKSSDLYEFH